uniref:Uncharacterized protein n=1 Tax=Arundo donax TaxID=35708 RepID=A0A0A9APQ5_ARUDO
MLLNLVKVTIYLANLLILCLTIFSRYCHPAASASHALHQQTHLHHTRFISKRCYYVRRSPLHRPQYLMIFPRQLVRRRSSEELNELINSARPIPYLGGGLGPSRRYPGFMFLTRSFKLLLLNATYLMHY